MKVLRTIYNFVLSVSQLLIFIANSQSYLIYSLFMTELSNLHTKKKLLRNI